MQTASATTSSRGTRRGRRLQLCLAAAVLIPLLSAGQAAAVRDGAACLTPLSRLKRQDPRPSCSEGTRAGGRLLHGAVLPDEGCGFRRIFPHRDERYGTDQIVSAVARAGSELSGGTFGRSRRDVSNPPLGVGNLSPPPHLRLAKDPFIGKRFSVSHTSGRAADFAFFVLDRMGRPVDSFETGIGYRGDGWNASGYRRYFLPAARAPGRQWGCEVTATFFGISRWKCFIPAGSYRFDDARNWALVRALLLDPAIGVVDRVSGRVRPREQGIRRMLISSPIRERLLSQARRSGEDSLLIDLAAAVMKQPGNALPHDDHLHVDLNCATEDIGRCGCVNSGVPPRPHEGRRIPLRNP